MRQYASLFLVTTILSFISLGCNTEPEEEDPTGINGSWIVTSWVEDGVAQPEVVQSEVVLVFTNTTMTISGTTFPFIYSGTYTLDGNNQLTAVLDETTGDSEINQYEFLVDATISAASLTLDGTMIAYSPFWPDDSKAIVIGATR